MVLVVYFTFCIYLSKSAPLLNHKLLENEVCLLHLSVLCRIQYHAWHVVGAPYMMAKVILHGPEATLILHLLEGRSLPVKK